MFHFSPLPLLPQELILKNLHPADLFYFSLLSRKSHLLAKRVKVNTDLVIWHFSEDRIIIAIRGDTSPLFFRMDVFSSESDQIVDKGGKFAVQIGGINFDVLPLSEVFIQLSTESPEVLAELVSCRFLDFLKVWQYRMIITTFSIPLFDLNYTKSFEDVKVEFANGALYGNDSLTLFNDISVNYFTMDCPVLEASNHQLAIKHRKMTLRRAKWFTREHLMRMECESLDLVASDLNSDDLQEFLEKWKEGMFPKLKKLSIEMIREVEWNLNVGPVDEEGYQIINDAGGNVGKVYANYRYFTFEVMPRMNCLLCAICVTNFRGINVDLDPKDPKSAGYLMTWQIFRPLSPRSSRPIYLPSLPSHNKRKEPWNAS